MFKNLSLEALGISGTQNETIELALSNGFKGIDLDLLELGRQVEARGMPHARRLLDSAKLKYGGFELPLPLSSDDAAWQRDLEQLKKLAALAAELGCTRAVTTLAPASDERPYHQNFEFHRQRLGAAAGVLEPLGVRLGVGFLAPAEQRQGMQFEFIYQFAPLLMLLNMVGRRNVGVVLDLWQLHAAGGGLDEIRGLAADQVVAVRVADFPADAPREAARDEQRLLPGETGVIDTPAALVALAEKGYDGPVTPYPHRSHFQGQRREEIARRAGQALDAVWKSAGLSPAGKLAAARK
jgi:sugar phosphate isomerase/epimerase